MGGDFGAEQPRWCLTIRWRGPHATLKDAALLRQFIPGLQSQSIPELHQWLRGLPAWKEDRLAEPALSTLRAEAEARGFLVEVAPVEAAPAGAVRPLLQLPPALPGRTQYSVHFSPAFHEQGYILVTLGPEGDSVSIAGSGFAETAALSTERGLQLLDALSALDPLGIPDGHLMGMDGITLRCHIQQENGSRTFTAWSPDARSAPRQHGFVRALYRLATEVAREPATVNYLEQLFGYIDNGLPVKVFDGVPRRIRLFGGLSSSDAEALEALFASVATEEPVLMDLSGFEGMGTLLHPLFGRFHARPGRTAWWVNAPAARHLKAVGVPPACLHQDLDSALAALRNG